jgi:putative acetyltransferase
VADIRVRRERPADVPAISSVLTAAFTTADTSVVVEPGLVDELRDSDAWLPALSMVGERDGEVVAHALLSRVIVEPGEVPALVLGPVAVRPADQRTGLGTAVVRAALDAARDSGETLVLVLGEPSYYRRFGFAPAAALTSPYSGSEYWQSLTLDASAAEVTGFVVFPPPWHGL